MRDIHVKQIWTSPLQLKTLYSFLVAEWTPSQIPKKDNKAYWSASFRCIFIRLVVTLWPERCVGFVGSQVWEVIYSRPTMIRHVASGQKARNRAFYSVYYTALLCYHKELSILNGDFSSIFIMQLTIFKDFVRLKHDALIFESNSRFLLQVAPIFITCLIVQSELPDIIA